MFGDRYWSLKSILLCLKKKLSRIGNRYWAPKIILINNETKIFFIPISDQ